MALRLAPLFLVLLPTLALAQSPDSTAIYPRSLGFADPGDVSALLEYRLPDWTWYTWDATLGLNADGADHESLSGSNFESVLGTNYALHRETDPRQWSLSAGFSGAVSRSEIDRDPPGLDRVDRDLSARGSLGAALTEYLVDWFGLSASGSVAGSYQESKTEVDTLPVSLHLGRRFDSRAYAGVTFGRARNVEPVLRAQRVSERLVELGRPALSPVEVRALADRIARRRGYLSVFDRSEKYFWAALLQEFSGGETLPARDLLYLLEVFEESYGLRLQGLRADVGVEYVTWRVSGDTGPHTSERWAVPRLSVSWYENLSLEHQLNASVTAQYAIQGDEVYDQNWRQLEAGIGDLLLLTDRWRWLNELTGSILSRQYPNNGEWIDSTGATARSSVVVFVEDRLSLNGQVYLTYRSDEFATSVDESWDYGARVSLAYQVGQGLY